MKTVVVYPITVWAASFAEDLIVSFVNSVVGKVYFGFGCVDLAIMFHVLLKVLTMSKYIQVSVLGTNV